MKKNMKKITRVAALTLASMLLFSACGQKAEVLPSSSVSTDSAFQAESKTGEDTEKPYWEMLDEVSDTSELPDWEGEILEVSVWIAGGTDTLVGTISEENVTFKEIERVTGVRFVPDDCYGNGGESIDAKLPKMVAGKDFPTIVNSYNTPTQMKDLYENGYLVDLTPYYEDGTLSNLQKYIPTDVFGDTYYADMKTDDGQYYLLPDGRHTVFQYWDAAGFEPEGYDAEYYNTYVADPTAANGAPYYYSISVRDDVLQALYPDALSLADIKQIWEEEGTFTEDQIFDIGLESGEDFWQLLYDIQELLKSGEYVGLDGRTMEVTFGPNSEADNWDWMTYLPQYLYPQLDATNYFSMFDANETDSTKLLKSAWETDYFQAFMKDLNALVNDDVIAQNSLVDNATTFTEKVNNGHYAVMYGQKALGYKVSEPNGEWAYRPIWVKAVPATDYNTLVSAGAPGYWGIFADSVTEEQLEQLLHAYNYLWSEVGGKCVAWGPASAGLFEEDENGVRRYTDSELEANLLYGADNEAGYKYGIIDSLCTTEQIFSNYFFGITSTLYSAKHTLSHEMERSGDEAYSNFVPGILGGDWVYATNGKQLVKTGFVFYNYGVGNVEGLKKFWGARSGFENQMKRVIAASPDNYDAEMQKLKDFCVENGWTDEAMLEYNEKWVAANEDFLKTAGYLK